MSTEEHPEGALLRRYLLGDCLLGEDQGRVERSYFESDVYFDQLLEAEDDLIDTYIRGGLTPKERVQFERHFLAAKRRRDRYEAMRTIAASFFRDSERTHHSLLKDFRDFFFMQSPALRTAIVAAGAVAMVVFGWLSSDYVRLRREDAAAQALLASARQVPANEVLAFTLRPGLLRSRTLTGNQIRLDPGVNWLVLHLETPALRDYSRFAATLSSAPGEEVLRQNLLVPVVEAIDLLIPASVLAAGQDYVVSLAGLERDGRRVDLQSYAFHVTR